MVRPNIETVSDEKVRKNTGKSRDHWFALLDKAALATHKERAELLVAEGVSGWWAQSVTVAYEQARGLRQPGQRMDGSFDASVSKTFVGGVESLWPFLVDATRRRRWLGPGWRVTGETPGKAVRLASKDGPRVVLSFYGPAPAGVSADKVRLSVQVSRLESADEVAAAKAEWKSALAKLADVVGRS